MSRLTTIDPQQATGQAKELLEAVQSKLRMTPNLMRVLANSPAALKAYLDFADALSKGSLAPKVREQIALAIGTSNGCEYCVSAHTAIGKIVGLTADELTSARSAASSDPKADAALKFAQRVVATKGRVSDNELQNLRAAGYGDGEIAEIVAHVGMNTFTNYFNHVAQTEVDFPKVAPAAA